MKRRVADLRGVRVGAAVQQQDPDCLVAAVSGLDQRSHPVWERIVDVRAGRQQEACGLDVAERARRTAAACFRRGARCS